jgi:transcription elongation factor GreB
MNAYELQCFTSALIRIHREHLLDSRWKDYEMRKGFTRQPRADEPATLVKNYITPGGLQRLKEEHRFLLTRERPAVAEVVAWAAGNGDRSENADYQYGKRRLRQIDGRIRFLTKRIEAAEVVDPEAPRSRQAGTRAYFAATVRYANAAGAERVVCIVGTDEVDLNRNHISFVSPLGRALIKSAAGDSVVLQAPGGTEDLTVLEVCYERISVEPFREPPGSESRPEAGPEPGSETSAKAPRRPSPDEGETKWHSG